MTIVIQIEPDCTLRSVAGWLGKDVEIAEDSCGRKWLRVAEDDVALRGSLARLCGRLYRLADQGRLVRLGAQVASASLENDLRWQPLDDVMKLRLPVAGLAGRPDPGHRVHLRLARGGRPADPAAAIVSAEKLTAWVDLASEIRLRRLRWVACGDEALVMGEPLPPIDAQYFIARDRILIPAGWRWLPDVSTDVLSESFGLRHDEWLIWREENHWSRVNDDLFATLRRASVRQLFVDSGDQVTS